MKHKKMKKFSIRLVLNHKGLVIDFWRKIPIMPKKFTKQDFNFGGEKKFGGCWGYSTLQKEEL